MPDGTCQIGPPPIKPEGPLRLGLGSRPVFFWAQTAHNGWQSTMGSCASFATCAKLADLSRTQYVRAQHTLRRRVLNEALKSARGPRPPNRRVHEPSPSHSRAHPGSLATACPKTDAGSVGRGNESRYSGLNWISIVIASWWCLMMYFMVSRVYSYTDVSLIIRRSVWIGCSRGSHHAGTSRRLPERDNH